MIKKETVELSISDVFQSSSFERFKIIDEMFKEQPALILLFQGAEKTVFEEEGEVLIRLACVIWRCFKNESISLNKISKKVLKKHLNNNIWMKRLAHDQKDSLDFIEKALNAYTEIELLKFCHYSIAVHWKEYIRTEGSARAIFYSLKTMIDCMAESTS